MLGLGIGLWANVAATSGGGGGGPTTNWTTANSNWAISGTNSNIATYTASTGWQLVKGNAAKSSGNFTVSWTDQLDSVGFGTAATATTALPPFDGTCAVYDPPAGAIYVGGTNVATVATSTVGDVIKCVNSSGTVSFFKQTGGTGSFVQLGATYDATGIGSSLYPIAAANEGGTVVVTANFTNF